MDLIFASAQSICVDILCFWIGEVELLKFDSSCCNVNLRSKLHKILCLPSFSLKGDCSPVQYRVTWLLLRSLKTQALHLSCAFKEWYEFQKLNTSKVLTLTLKHDYIYGPDTYNIGNISQAINSCHGLTCLKLLNDKSKVDHDSVLNRISIEIIAQLKHLEIESPHISEEGLRILANHCSNLIVLSLKSLTINLTALDIVIPQIIRGNCNLTDITIDFYNKLWPSSLLQALCESTLQLKSLVLSRSRDLELAEIQQLLTCCRELVTLQLPLFSRTRLKNSDFSYFSDTGEKSVAFDGFHSSAEEFVSFFEAHTGFTSVSFRNCSTGGITDQVIYSISDNCRLKLLCVHYCGYHHSIDSLRMLMVKHGNHMYTLELSYCSHSAHQLVDLMSIPNAITRLTLKSTHQLPFDLVVSMLQLNPQIKTLALCNGDPVVNQLQAYIKANRLNVCLDVDV